MVSKMVVDSTNDDCVMEMYRTRTNFRGTYISRMPQIQHFPDFIFEDRRILYW